MKIDTEQNIRRLGVWFEKTGKPLYLVGGYVRNKLLNLQPGDIDVCAAVPPQALAALANGEFTVTERAYGLGTLVIGQVFGEERYTYEYTAFRSDSYGRGGEHRPDSVAFTQDIKKDAARRDFTVNALYADTDGNVGDPLAAGLADLETGLIRACGPATLEEDALRILRMVRFSAELGFAVEAETLATAQANAGKLANISAERIREEFFKILMADTKYGNETAVLGGLQLLKKLGALRYIVPELLDGDGFAQAAQYHKYDVLDHSLHTCAAACPDLRVRLAALLHDVSKPEVYGQDGNMYRHPERGAQVTKEILERLRADNALVRDVTQLVAAHMFDLDNRAKKKTVVRMLTRLGRAQFLRLCCLREADFAGSGRGAKADSAQKWRDILRELEEAGAPLDARQLAVNGNDVMCALGLPPGRSVGELLRRLHDYALKKPAQNNYTSLIRYAKMLYTGRNGGKNPDGG